MFSFGVENNTDIYYMDYTIWMDTRFITFYWYLVQPTHDNLTFPGRPRFRGTAT